MDAKDKRDRLQQLEGYAKTLVAAVRIIDERRYILQPLLWDEEVRESLAAKFEDTYGGHAYNHLVPLLAQDLVRDLAKLFSTKGERLAVLSTFTVRLPMRRYYKRFGNNS